MLIKLLEDKNVSCTPPAYMEFPPDLFGNRARSKGAIIVHLAVVLYMFYCLAIVCENYFLPSLEQCCVVSFSLHKRCLKRVFFKG